MAIWSVWIWRWLSERVLEEVLRKASRMASELCVRSLKRLKFYPPARVSGGQQSSLYPPETVAAKSAAIVSG